MFASNSLNKVKKLMFKPIARGISPSMVVMAVSKTGLRRALPAFMICSSNSDFGKYSEPVLCFHTDGHYEDCQLNESDFDDSSYWSYIQDGDLCETVTHWQPLPKSPKQI